MGYFPPMSFCALLPGRITGSGILVDILGYVERALAHGLAMK
jgi:hypothetical protein